MGSCWYELRSLYWIWKARGEMGRGRGTGDGDFSFVWFENEDETLSNLNCWWFGTARFQILVSVYLSQCAGYGD